MCSRLIPLWSCWVTGAGNIRSRFVKILKHSSIPSLQVIDGLKITSVFSLTQAASFLAFLLGVSDRLSLISIVNGLYFGARSLRRVSASMAQAWGFLQPLSLSQAHLAHMHTWDGSWREFRVRSLIFLVSFIRSATDFALCLFSMHFILTFVSGRGAAPGWYHAGSLARTPGDILIAARFVWYFFATLSILLMFGFIISDRGPLVGGSHVCRNVLISAITDMLGGAEVFISMSVALAHICLEGVRLR
jgi:hypothetical protein